jgi:hypothetical protein
MLTHPSLSSPGTDMHLLIDNDVNGEAMLTPKVNSRPYFFVVAEKGAGLWTAERVLVIV